jgi:hypothetical protein
MKKNDVFLIRNLVEIWEKSTEVRSDQLFSNLYFDEVVSRIWDRRKVSTEGMHTLGQVHVCRCCKNGGEKIYFSFFSNLYCMHIVLTLLIFIQYIIQYII